MPHLEDFSALFATLLEQGFLATGMVVKETGDVDDLIHKTIKGRVI